MFHVLHSVAGSLKTTRNFTRKHGFPRSPERPRPAQTLGLSGRRPPGRHGPALPAGPPAHTGVSFHFLPLGPREHSGTGTSHAAFQRGGASEKLGDPSTPEPMKTAERPSHGSMRLAGGRRALAGADDGAGPGLGNQGRGATGLGEVVLGGPQGGNTEQQNRSPGSLQPNSLESPPGGVEGQEGRVSGGGGAVSVTGSAQRSSATRRTGPREA